MSLPKRGLLIFDLDGTLFRTDICSVRALVSVFRDHGLAAPPTEQWVDCFGMPEEDFVAWLEIHAGEGRGQALMVEIAQRELEMVPHAGRLYPGAMDVLKRLRMRVEQMAVCSNGPELYVRTVVASMGLEGCFDAVRWRRDGDRSKAEMIADLMSQLRARPAIVIGDRAEDIGAARANGGLAIGAAYGYGRTGELEGADLVVSSPGGLPGAVDRLLACEHE